MRQDAKALLERLGQQKFRYQEFPDRFPDMELWPLFEALLKDPRVIGEEGSRVDAREAAYDQSRGGASEPVHGMTPEGLLDRLYAQYQPAAADAQAPKTESPADSDVQVDVSAFLATLQGGR